MAFKYASAYNDGFGRIDPINPGADLSTDASDSLSQNAFKDFALESDFAASGLDAVGKQRIAYERAQAYKKQADAIRAQADAAKSRGTLGGIGKIVGGIAGLFNPIAGAAISGASGFLG